MAEEATSTTEATTQTAQVDTLLGGVTEAATTETQAPGDVKPGEKAPEQKPVEGAPEAYAAFTAPEGTTYTDGMLSAFGEAAKEANLSQESAQKLLDKLAPAYAKLSSDHIETAKATWTAASQADKEFGGPKLAENIAVANKALSEFGTPELFALLKDTGLSNHPEVIRAFYRAGKAISEDRFVAGKSEPSKQRDPRDLFPNSNLNP